MSRQSFMDALMRRNRSGRPVFGTGTSIVSVELMQALDIFFPDAHLDPEKMAGLAMAGHTVLGLDVVMPLFSVCHEAAAMGCDVNWGAIDSMPESGPPLFTEPEHISIPADLLQRPGCAVPLRAIALLRQRLGADAAVCGKVFGSWTQSYHYFGLENFLIMTVEAPDKVHRILDRLLPVTLQFARAQIEAGADCLLLADHATRDLCSPQAYVEFLQNLHRRLAAEIEVPLILHICGNTGDRIRSIRETGLACFHYDTTTGSPDEVRRLAGGRLALMGGISNLRLLNRDAAEIRADSRVAQEADIDIVGPECAVPLTTPLANLKAIAAPPRT